MADTGREQQTGLADTSVLVCRGCCCGTRGKHPDVDHDEQLRRIEAAVEARRGGVVRVVACVDECPRSNVVIVRHRRANCSAVATETTWLGSILDAAVVDALTDWIRVHGGDPRRMPQRLRPHRFEPRRRPPRESPVWITPTGSGEQ